jgi:hypothetical protein
VPLVADPLRARVDARELEERAALVLEAHDPVLVERIATAVDARPVLGFRAEDALRAADGVGLHR